MRAENYRNRTDPDDTASICRAIAALPPSGGVIDLDAPTYYLSSGLTWADKPVTLRGGGCGNQPGSGTQLIFAPGVTGITAQNGPNGMGANSCIENLRLRASDVVAGTNDGIRVQANSMHLRNVEVQGFGGCGVHVLSAPSSAEVSINANRFHIDGLRTYNNKGHGLHIEGVDSNAGVTVALDATANDGWGLYENSFLGNTHIAPHVAGNLTGGYRFGAITRSNTVIGAYGETDGLPGVQLDGPGGANNYLMFAQMDNPITDNTTSKSNTILTNVGGSHFSRLAVGGPQSSDIILTALLALFANGSKIQLQDKPLTANWFIQAVAGNVRIDSAGSGSLITGNPIAAKSLTLTGASILPGDSCSPAYLGMTINGNNYKLPITPA